jgi:hypothetical protein
LFVELVKERGCNPFDLAAQVAEQLELAVKVAKEISRENIHYIPRDVVQYFLCVPKLAVKALARE